MPRLPWEEDDAIGERDMGESIVDARGADKFWVKRAEPPKID